MGAVASADGKYIYYAMRHGGFAYNAQLPLWQIRAPRPQNWGRRRSAQQLESSFRPVLSPDGTQILYVTRYETESGCGFATCRLATIAGSNIPSPATIKSRGSLRDLFPGYAFLARWQRNRFNQDGKIRRLNLATGADTIIPFTAKVSQELGPKLDFPQRVEDGPVKARLIQTLWSRRMGSSWHFRAHTPVHAGPATERPRRVTTATLGNFSRLGRRTARHSLT